MKRSSCLLGDVARLRKVVELSGKMRVLRSPFRDAGTDAFYIRGERLRGDWSNKPRRGSGERKVGDVTGGCIR